MPRPMTTFSLDDQPEVFFSTTATSRAIRRHLAGDDVRQIQGRLTGASSIAQSAS
jgi:filamentous hemagglutinin family protein